MINNFYNANANRSYPFISRPANKDDKRLKNAEILDCRFYIDNPSTSDLKVYLDSKDVIGNTICYTFKNTGASDSPLVFIKSGDVTDWSTIWSYNEDWYGMIVVGKTEDI